MSENNIKDLEIEDIYKDAPGLDPDLEWEEGPIDEAAVEEVPVERIGDFMVRGGDEVAQYVGTGTVAVIPEGITKIDSFLLEGKHVTEVRIPSTVVEISRAAFFEASDLKNIFVDEANSAYKSIDGCLYDKSGKSFIRCPSDRELVEIAEGTEKVEYYAFFQCSVKEIKFPSTLKLLEEGAFMSCSIWEKMDEFVLPDGVELGKEVFMYSTLPPRITLQGVTKLPDRAFADAVFGAVRLPDTLTEIEDRAFGNCLMSRVYVPKSVVKLGESVFESDRPCEGVESSDAFYDPTDGYGLYDEEDNEESTAPVDNTSSCPDGFVFGVDNEECAAAQYARENNIPYEVVTDVEEFLNAEPPAIYRKRKMMEDSNSQQVDDDSPF